MNDNARENLLELLRRFMDDAAAQAAQADIEAAERVLEASPAPMPSPQTVASIKALTRAAAAASIGEPRSSAARWPPPRR
jgi:hypothetical protein